MNLPISTLAVRRASAVLFTLAAAGGTIGHARADSPSPKRSAVPSPRPTASANITPCADCPPIIIGHPRGGENPNGILVGPEEMKIFPSPHPFNGHVYSVTRSAGTTTVLEDGVAKMTITFHGNKAYIGLPGSKPLVVINVAP